MKALVPCYVVLRCVVVLLAIAGPVWGEPMGTIANPAEVVAVTQQSYDKEVVKSPQPVLIHFWAPWAGPCRLQAPALAEVAKQYRGRVKFGKIDVDASPKLTEQFKVTDVPTLILLEGGKETLRVKGLQSKEKLAELLDKKFPGKSP